MPEQITTTVPSSKVLRGDLIDGSMVLAVERKDKYTYIDREGATRIKAFHDEPQRVTRTQETAEERRAGIIEWTARSLRREADAAQASVVAQAGDVADRAATYQVESLASTMTDLIERMARRDIWATVESARQHLAATDTGMSPDEVFLTAVVTVTDELTKQVLKNWLSGTSTSPQANAIREIKREQTCRFIEGAGLNARHALR